MGVQQIFKMGHVTYLDHDHFVAKNTEEHAAEYFGYLTG